MHYHKFGPKSQEYPLSGLEMLTHFPFDKCQKVSWVFCWIQVCTPEALKPAETSYVLGGLTTQFQQQYPISMLISCTSLSTVCCTVTFLYKVFSIFLSQYLFAIGLVQIFSFRRSLTHRKCYAAAAQGVPHGIVTLYDVLFQATFKHIASSLKALLETTIRHCQQQRILVKTVGSPCQFLFLRLLIYLNSTGSLL